MTDAAPPVLVEVTKKYLIRIDGTEAQYIALADSLFSGGLDSPDAGDATGAFIDWAEQDGNSYDGECLISGCGATVTVDIEYQLPFQWTGKLT